MKKINASVCILTLNEEENLPRCLSALADFEEILIYDSGSVDKTLEIARSHGASIIEGEWEGFGATRKKLFQAATQPWIFWLDADEVVPDQLAREILVCVEGDPEMDGYYINRITWIGQKRFRFGNWYPDWNLRFFRRDSWRMEDRVVHESVRVPGKCGRFSFRLEHFSYRDWSEREKRGDRYAKLWAEQAFHGGKRVSRIDPISHSWGCFIKGFIMKFGFLDGIEGFRLAVSNSREVAKKYQLLLEMREGSDA